MNASWSSAAGSTCGTCNSTTTSRISPRGPTVDLTWVRWGERWGAAIGVFGVLSHVDVNEGNYTVERRLPVYGHVTVRYRFRPDGNGNVWSIGVGSPWAIFWERNRPRIWDSERGSWTMDRRPEAVEGELAAGTLLMHTEVLVTRQVSEQVKVRAGVRVAPFLYPLMLQPVVLGVWGF